MKALEIVYVREGVTGTLRVPDVGEDSDVWDCVMAYDDDHGTHYMDLLEADDITEVRETGEEYHKPVSVTVCTMHRQAALVVIDEALKRAGGKDGNLFRVTVERVGR